MRDNFSLKSEINQEKKLAGDIIPFERGASPIVKDDYTKAIQSWCQTRNTAEALSREEIGAMRAFDRIDAQRKSIIVNLAHYYRLNERADVAPGLLTVLTLLSDNDEGSAKISQEKLALLFGRSRTAISQAQMRLKKADIVRTSRGRYAKTYPVIPRAVTRSYNHIAWTIDAICTPEASVNCKGRLDNCQLQRPPYQLSQLQRPAGQLEEVNCKDKGVSIAKAALSPIHYENSTTVVTRAAKVVATGIATAMSAIPVAAEPPPKPPFEQPAQATLADKLFAAGGVAMNRTQATLEVMAIPRRWLDAGCDLEVDILPTISALASKKPPNSISSWKFFEGAIADAKASREAPMPRGEARPDPSKPDRRNMPEWKRKELEALDYIFDRN